MYCIIAPVQKNKKVFGHIYINPLCHLSIFIVSCFCMIMNVFASNLINLCYLMLSLSIINLVRVLFAEVIFKFPSVHLNDSY